MTIAEELNQLRKMREDGTITEEQYERAVAELEGSGRQGAPARDEHRSRQRYDGYDDGPDEPTPRQREKKAREWAMYLHLSLLVGHFALIAGIVAPVLMWQSKKDEWPRIDAHGKNAVNWLISYYLYLAVSGALCFVFIGFVLLPVVIVLGIVFPIIAATKANEGRTWTYPLAIPFLT